MYDQLKAFTYFPTKSSQSKILCSNPAEDKIVK